LEVVWRPFQGCLEVIQGGLVGILYWYHKNILGFIFIEFHKINLEILGYPRIPL
jgi:hypothetical protein